MDTSKTRDCRATLRRRPTFAAGFPSRRQSDTSLAHYPTRDASCTARLNTEVAIVLAGAAGEGRCHPERAHRSQGLAPRCHPERAKRVAGSAPAVSHRERREHREHPSKKAVLCVLCALREKKHVQAIRPFPRHRRSGSAFRRWRVKEQTAPEVSDAVQPISSRTTLHASDVSSPDRTARARRSGWTRA